MATATGRLFGHDLAARINIESIPTELHALYTLPVKVLGQTTKAPKASFTANSGGIGAVEADVSWSPIGTTEPAFPTATPEQRQHVTHGYRARRP